MTKPSSHCPRCDAPLPGNYEPERPCPRCLLALGLSEPESVDDPEPRDAGEAPPSPEQLAADFPQLEIEEIVGEGGMGIVYRAKQRDLQRTVALKLLRRESTEDPMFAERFSREARALGSLSHPNIVGVHDFGRAGEHYYLVMEFIDGTNLRHILDRGEIRADQALHIVEQVCAALHYAHDHGVIHRDIKPENILIDRAGVVKLVDFGLVKVTGREPSNLRLTHTHQAMGTPQYMAPEQIERPLEVDHRADIYSLGVVFYELLTGELPLGRFDAPSAKVEIDVRLDRVVLRSLEKEPARRFQHASEVGSEIHEIRTHPAAPAAAPTRTARHGRRIPAWGWIVLIMLLVSCVPMTCAVAALLVAAPG